MADMMSRPHERSRMHPNTFLRTFWQLEVKPQIFVAMSFAPEYHVRYEQVIARAISPIRLNGTPLAPYRVDISKSGDSILTDIMEGVAHSRMILVDISSVGRDSKTGEPYRNGNVMYEVGLALACRHPSEILLVRDDRDKFLFDGSTVSHMYLDFTDIEKARAALQIELEARLRAHRTFASIFLSSEPFSSSESCEPLPSGSAEKIARACSSEYRNRIDAHGAVGLSIGMLQLSLISRTALFLNASRNVRQGSACTFIDIPPADARSG
jgi:hypothetical protein